MAYAQATATVLNLEQKRAEYMGNPQLDDGHTRIANELYEAIINFPFTGPQYKVVLSIIRKTYGFNKKADRVAQSVLSEMTGLAKPNVCRVMKQLRQMKVVLIDDSKMSHLVEFNKRYKEWEKRYQSDNSYQNDSYQPDNETVITEITKPLSAIQPQKKERKKDKEFSIPDWIPAESWDGFVAMRKAIKNPMTDRAYKLIVKQLDDFRNQGFDIGAILDASTVNNWKSVYPLKDQRRGSKTFDPSVLSL